MLKARENIMQNIMKYNAKNNTGAIQAIREI